MDSMKKAEESLEKNLKTFGKIPIRGNEAIKKNSVLRGTISSTGSTSEDPGLHLPGL